MLLVRGHEIHFFTTRPFERIGERFGSGSQRISTQPGWPLPEPGWQPAWQVLTYWAWFVFDRPERDIPISQLGVGPVPLDFFANDG